MCLGCFGWKNCWDAKVTRWWWAKCWAKVVLSLKDCVTWLLTQFLARLMQFRFEHLCNGSFIVLLEHGIVAFLRFGHGSWPRVAIQNSWLSPAELLQVNKNIRKIKGYYHWHVLTYHWFVSISSFIRSFFKLLLLPADGTWGLVRRSESGLKVHFPPLDSKDSKGSSSKTVWKNKRKKRPHVLLSELLGVFWLSFQKKCNTLSEDLIQLRTNKLGAHKIPKKCGSGRGVFMLFCHSETAVLRCNSLQDFEKNTQFCWRRWSQSLRFDGEWVVGISIYLASNHPSHKDETWKGSAEIPN